MANWPTFAFKRCNVGLALAMTLASASSSLRSPRSDCVSHNDKILMVQLDRATEKLRQHRPICERLVDALTAALDQPEQEY